MRLIAYLTFFLVSRIYSIMYFESDEKTEYSNGFINNHWIELLFLAKIYFIITNYIIDSREPLLLPYTFS